MPEYEPNPVNERFDPEAKREQRRRELAGDPLTAAAMEAAAGDGIEEPSTAANLRDYLRSAEPLARAKREALLDSDPENAPAVERARRELFAALLSDYAEPLDVRPFAGYANEKMPERLIWADAGPNSTGAILSAGDIAILSGAGGAGKSTLALQLARAAAADENGRTANVCGLGIACGPVLYASYEDVPAVQYKRAKNIESAIPRDLYGVKMFGRPLFGPQADGSGNDVPGPLPAFRPLLDAATRLRARLLIIDPASAAFTSPAAGVEWTRMFLDALRTEAEKIGCGILLIAHSTKAARGSESDNPQSVAGSAAWHDAARGVLVLHPKRRIVKKNDERVLNPRIECLKSNYGPKFKDIYLQWEAGGWRRGAENENAILGYEQENEGF